MHSAFSLALLNLCHLKEGLDECLMAFELTKKVGDDARMSVLASNMCVIETARGMYAEAIRWGETSIALGEASHSSTLQMTFTNLVDAYLLVGREADAVAQMNERENGSSLDGAGNFTAHFYWRVLPSNS